MAPELDQEAAHAWVFLLLDEFRQLQAAIPLLQAVPPPNLVLSSALTRTLGRWDADNRQLTLSTRLLLAGSFADVRRVFKHELAHQVVSELYGLPQAVPHGEAFARACRLLGIPAQADEELHADLAPGANPLLERVQKLMALGSSTNRHEAALALAKARELALRHNLAALPAPAPGYGLRPLAPVFRRIPAYIWSICGIVSDFYFTRYICRQYVTSLGARAAVIELYGQPANLDLAEYVYTFLRRQGEQEWQAYRAGHGPGPRRLKLSFLDGLYAGYREKLEAQTVRLAQTRALVWTGDPRLEAFFRERNPQVNSRRISTPLVAGAHAAGVAVGRRLKLRGGLPASAPGAAGPRRLLGGG